jgi:antirestriction protein ArdC
MGESAPIVAYSAILAKIQTGSTGNKMKILTQQDGKYGFGRQIELAAPHPDHAAYIASWLKVLKDDKRAIFTAASHAQKAADYLHGLQPQEAQS